MPLLLRPLSRRSLIASGLALPGLWAASKLARASSLWSAPEMLVAVGVMPAGEMPFHGQTEASSSLAIFAMATRQSRHVTLPMPGGHSLLQIPGGYMIVGNRGALGVVDATFAAFRKLAAPEGWHFGGHGVYLPERAAVLLGLRPDTSGKVTGEGRIVLVDPASLSLVDVGTSGGLEPHDMLIRSDGQIAVANYGNATKSALSTYDDMRPTICILDRKTLALVETVAVPGIGSVSHIAEGEGGTLAALPARLKALSRDSLSSVDAELLGAEVELTAAELVEGKVGYPSPVLTLDGSGKKWTSHLAEPARQRRPQSIAYHAPTRSWFVTYPFSEQIMRVRIGEAPRLVASFDVGISYPRGVATFGSDPSVYVCGQYRGIVRIDARTLARQDAWNVSLGDATHVVAL
jgi:DNA-binding beta-propeller fold protein YncE